jgi:DNA mismatch endonuclease (patch repair protein)
MRAVRDRDTRPELLVRSLAHRLGFRFRLHRSDLPGKPDLVFVARRKVIFVNGCFWHGHNCKEGRRQPKSHQDYWGQKIQQNRIRDTSHVRALKKAGWQVFVIWECQLRNEDLVARRIAKFLA